jgi:hypothetical protein
MAQRTFIGAMDPRLVQFGRHAPGTRIAAAPDPVQTLLQFGICRIDAEPEDMHGLIITPGNGYLNTIHKRQTDLICHRPRFGQSAKFVVIGQGEQFHAVLLRAADDLSRAQQAVRDRRMAVQISIEWFHAVKNSSIN